MTAPEAATTLALPGPSRRAAPLVSSRSPLLPAAADRSFLAQTDHPRSPAGPRVTRRFRLADTLRGCRKTARTRGGSRRTMTTTIGTNAAVALAAEHEAAGRYDDAVNELARAAESGDVDATTELGKHLILGDLGPHLPHDGTRMLVDAVAAGSVEAALRLATLAALGTHVEQSWSRALGSSCSRPRRARPRRAASYSSSRAGAWPTRSLRLASGATRRGGRLRDLDIAGPQRFAARRSGRAQLPRVHRGRRLLVAHRARKGQPGTRACLRCGATVGTSPITCGPTLPRVSIS